MGFIMKNEKFICEKCLKEVSSHPTWSARNHCKFCLYSKHVDKDFPWDRKSSCLSPMKPIWIEYKKNKNYMIIHKCEKCSKEILNKVAPDDNFIEFIKINNKNHIF